MEKRKINYKNQIQFGVALLVILSVTGCFGPSETEIARASDHCVEFYKEKRASENSHVEAIGSWMKEGMLVIELAEKESSSDSSWTAALCLYDEKSGVMKLPSLFNQDKWEK